MEEKIETTIIKLNFQKQVCFEALKEYSTNHPSELVPFEKEKIETLLKRMSDLMSGLIQISPENFKLGEFSTKTTVYHELGHYVLKLEHNSCIIMEKGNRKESFYRENWEGCLTEYISAAGKD